MRQPNDLSRSLVALKQDATLIAVIEMSQSSWFVAGIAPGVERQPFKKLVVILLNSVKSQVAKVSTVNAPT